MIFRITLQDLIRSEPKRITGLDSLAGRRIAGGSDAAARRRTLVTRPCGADGADLAALGLIYRRGRRFDRKSRKRFLRA